MPATAVPCADCQSKDGAHEIRRRRLCSDCFVRYVHSKVFKRMESFRFRNNSTGDAAKKRLMLPLSGGLSSLALLHILDAQLTRQRERQSRTAYELILVHVDTGSTDRGTNKGPSSSLAASLLSSHTALPDVAIHDALRVDGRLEDDLARLGVARAAGQSNGELYRSLTTAAAATATARADVEQIFLKRLLVCLARQHGCESILWGHSDTRLAALALADVAKGRGGSVPMTLYDGPPPSASSPPSPIGVRFNYPLRDLFKTELELYARVLRPEPLVAAADAAAMAEGGIRAPGVRNTSIDNLLSTYIVSQGEKYPSIMANVVRTASKLQVGQADDATALCVLCFGEVSSRRQQQQQQSSDLCYGCQRMQQDIKVAR